MTQMSNPHKAQPTSLKALVASLVKNRQLVYQMTKREVIGRYKGSVFGLAWSFFNPIVMLIIYTFVFSVVFKARWGANSSDSKTEFALILFVGLIIFNLFAEVINRAPGLILNNVNYVKKVVFPLEILPVISFGVVLFHACISVAVMLFAFLLLNGFINWTAIFLPIVLLPFALLILGISWFIASLGVFARDIGQAIGVFTTLIMFLSPVFYPTAALPRQFQFWILLNPVSFIIEQARAVLFFGQIPDWLGLSLYFIFAAIVMLLGFAWFQKTRKGFADVL
ncbi:ABC transporter permease [Polynucleobacter asymbioticus]|uniref:Transport permease protein n=1 Tax=Polynucleobacter asymbioticus (strain DSM 18221 / CIP 109841 / QLW-P1DMWA-1) TaxID=312153 RepID=A4SVM5_POLAQ|nr:ABC-2 type transporter [Polynucleobacter asymbioticus QLW-P1DMWA-1]